MVTREPLTLADAIFGIAEVAALAAEWSAADQTRGGACGSSRPEAAHGAESAAQCAILRCIFGNPFRPVSLDPSWRTPDVRTLAGGIYEERVFNRLPYLADALEEAGCTDRTILDHCRDGGEHWRGCWVVDLVRSVD
jgi:hypothetical protein